jgi:membrane fusion protein (multidrug efflux system)
MKKPARLIVIALALAGLAGLGYVAYSANRAPAAGPAAPAGAPGKPGGAPGGFAMAVEVAKVAASDFSDEASRSAH